MELLKNAWLGWETYIENGKLVILLPAALLYFFCVRTSGLKKSWLWYTLTTMIACVCPATAAVLMRYQTPFYDYINIWGIVPVTACMACGITVFLWNVWSEKEEKNKTRAVGATVLLGVILLLCGSMGMPVQEQDGSVAAYQLHQRDDMADAIGTVQALRETCGEGATLVLWAPSEIMEAARVADSAIVLLYGRNMWDKSLDAYAYDVYSPETEFLYRCMKEWESTKQSLEEEKISPETLAGMAREAGVNCIMLPMTMERIKVARMARSMGIRVQKLEAYWLLYE